MPDDQPTAAEHLKAQVHAAFGMPAHLRDALLAWIDAVEERLDPAVAPAVTPAEESARRRRAAPEEKTEK